jgi:hypothetical protein
MPACPKIKRIVDKDLIQQILDEQGTCLVGLDGYYGCCFGDNRLPHHIKSRGSGGGDARGNIIRVCLHHHQMAHNSLIPKKYLYELLEKFEEQSYD